MMRSNDHRNKRVIRLATVSHFECVAGLATPLTSDLIRCTAVVRNAEVHGGSRVFLRGGRRLDPSAPVAGAAVARMSHGLTPTARCLAFWAALAEAARQVDTTCASPCRVGPVMLNWRRRPSRREGSDERNVHPFSTFCKMSEMRAKLGTYGPGALASLPRPPHCARSPADPAASQCSLYRGRSCMERYDSRRRTRLTRRPTRSSAIPPVIPPKPRCFVEPVWTLLRL